MEEMDRCSATGLRYTGLYGFPPTVSSGLVGAYNPGLRNQDSGLCYPDA